ncbi:MAG: hypothetical protein JOS17DRAFT_820707 [Linnemannia elongata]|nr:MAG: hypothetical protein JOS17DRAFT_820707 [Linnemannia elongata]
MQQDLPQEQLQGIRSISKYSRNTLATPDPTDVVYVDVHKDSDTKKLLKPFRIAAMSDVVLNVFCEGEYVLQKFPIHNRRCSGRLSYRRLGNNFDRTLNNYHHPPMSTAGYALQLNPKQRGLKDAREAIRRFRKAASEEHDFAQVKEIMRKVTALHRPEFSAGPRIWPSPQDFLKVEEGFYRTRRSPPVGSSKPPPKDHVLAQLHSGVIYESGQGVSQDFSQALRWYLKAAHQGFAYAQYSVGLVYHGG